MTFDLEILDSLAASAYIAYTNTLCGNQSLVARAYYERATGPRPGDLVLEITNWKAHILNRIGRLISVGMENPPPETLDPATYNEEDWGKPYPPYQEKVWRIRTLDGREFRWWNANFIVIPESPWAPHFLEDSNDSNQKD